MWSSPTWCRTVANKQVEDTHPIDLGAVSKFIGRSVNVTIFHAAAGSEGCKGVHVVVASGAALGCRQSAELADPDDQRIVQESSTFQI